MVKFEIKLVLLVIDLFFNMVELQTNPQYLIRLSFLTELFIIIRFDWRTKDRTLSYRNTRRYRSGIQ